ncbi:MAG: hypothetical protein ACUVRA_00770 [Candidatus Bathyarchaeaceae archaeon]
MKTWAAKTLQTAGYKRPILASLISAVLIISIIYLGSFPPAARSGSGGGSSNSFVVYLGNATMTTVVLEGPYIYNSMNVTKITADVVNMVNMSLIKEGSRLELGVLTAFATKLVMYTTYFEAWTPMDNIVKIRCYGYETVYLPADWFIIRPPEEGIWGAHMEVVYMQAESFSALGLSLSCVSG